MITNHLISYVTLTIRLQRFEKAICVFAQIRRGALRAPAFPTKVSLILERAHTVRPYTSWCVAVGAVGENLGSVSER